METIQQVNLGLIETFALIFVSEVFMYLWRGRQLRDVDGEYGMITYLYNRQMQICLVLGMWVLTDTCYLLMGELSLARWAARVLSSLTYPFILTAVVEFLWSAFSQDE